MPAALRSVAGPRALLPPLSPHLGPIVGLGAPGEDGGKDAARGGRGKETARTEESAREGRGGEGSPALRPVRGVSTAKLSQFKRRLPRPASPAGHTVRESPEEWGNKAEVEEGERPGGHSLVSPAPEWAAEAAAASGDSRVRG